MSDEANAIQTTILNFVCQELIAEDMSVAVDDDLLSGELLDSLAVLRLATFVDQEFSIGMQPTDFLIENFQTVAVLSAFVARCIETRS